MMEDDKLSSPKTFSAATSPIKDTIRHGSRELAKKLISRDVQTEKYAGFNSSSSSEKVNKNISLGSSVKWKEKDQRHENIIIYIGKIFLYSSV